MEALRKEEAYTTDDIYALPDGERAELIDGKIYYMAPPNRTHQKIVHFLDWAIEDYIRSKNGSCEVYPAPFAVFPNKDKTNYVEPDISVICDPSKLDEKGCHGAPDWVIEVVSQSSSTMDCFIKLIKYTNSGVREYWIVDPDKKEVTVYKIEKEEMERYSFDDEVPVGIFEGFSLRLSV